MPYVIAIPKPGVRIRRPDTGRPLDPVGETVEPSAFWRRREKDGEVTFRTQGTDNPAGNPTPPDISLPKAKKTKA